MVPEKPARYGGEPIRDEVLGYGGQSITEREKEAVVEALEGDYITRGPTVTEFEERVADLVGVEHAIATTSGTTALHLAGEAAGFGPGDEVITTPLTFVSTAHAATYTGATPVFADIDPHRRTLDPDAVRDQITDDTVGLVPMHYAGHPADIEGLLEVADEQDLTVIWDACHAFGGTWEGEPIGAQRDLAIFSFHPVKSVTTGEGGMVVTDDDDLAARIRRLRSFDMSYDPDGHEEEPWYQVAEGVGYNYNVTDIQAALGLTQLDRLDDFKRRRDEIIEQYDEAFAEIDGIRTPPQAANADPLYHLYAIEVSEEFGCDCKEFVNAMHAENIGVQVHYVPLHFHPLFQDRYGYTEGDFPATERVYERIVSLPFFPEMDSSDVRNVVQAIDRLHQYHAE
ncbi:DegT/DnrJ/EryC1/StrS family aminotransferase [Halobellus limi]|uniref:DegT/DnrJ/EryC1/StrS family aminotransferase n=1 Tax=Halobellus limi TaxID=699433 RepID=A0A1H5URL3_9EURY|nr:DegT/DnrJ/EryC1/StrS family aminotransferase [Halobellus limi]QCC46945.1 DegT/DnrJ/EryC1/StrS family aminotransferase [Halobellus limi]SEF77752.1 dTDP-4-amino-4,6-dideoxygalactose transaminase [Halobellus limi]